MSLAVFLAICAAGSLLGLLALPFPRLARLVGVVALIAAFVAALTIKPADELTVGQVQLATSWYAGLFLSTATLCCLIVCLLGLVVGWPERLAPAALATFAGLAVAFTATDPGVVFAAVAASAIPAVLVAIGSSSRSTEASEPAVATHALDVSLSELRTLGLIAAGALIASVVVLQPGWTASDPTFVFALAYLALGLAVAVRFGAVPFHVPAARLSKSSVKLGLALPLVWIPAGLGIVTLSWSTSVFQMRSDWLDAAVAGLQVIAVATLILGALGALLHEEIEEIATYSIIQDAAFVLLALAARDADAAGPMRLWLLTFIVAKSALVAWVAALSATFGSSQLQDLRGWLRRAPILGLALAAIVVATLGWPGSAVFDARATLIRLALPSEVQFLGIAAVLLSISYYGRLVAVGLMAPGERVRSSNGERPRRPKSLVAASGAVASASVAPAPEAAADAAPSARRSRARASRAAARALSAAAPLEVSAAPESRGPRRPANVNRAAGTARRSLAKALRRFGSACVRSIRGAVPDARQLPLAWRLNRTLETSLLVLGISALSVAIAFGSFGASRASSSGISLDAVLAPTPQLPVTGNDAPLGPSPTPSIGTTGSPAPSSASASPSGSGTGPTGSASPGTSPSASSSGLPSQLTGD
jgi:NADH:ubiquinone oxidoreductase subunit 2 (subunit N)